MNVFLDEEYVFSLPLDEAARLSKGQTLTDAEVEALMEQSAVGLALDQGLRLLAMRPRSASEITQHLTRSGVAVPVVGRAVDRLTELGYLDDWAFASFWVQERMRFKPTSPRALRYELKQKGVENAVIDAALEVLDGDEAAYRAAATQIKKLRGTSKRVFQEKLNAVLLRRGFSFSQARQTIRRWIDELEADTPDYFADDSAAPRTYDD
ncbi:MAG: RecX family transcriptional regulator [Chloroflexota bacterium]|nr:RecX family transcriptional regulator [Chloroflexota bacterium]